MKHFVVGRGEIGSAIIEILDLNGEEVYSFDIRDEDGTEFDINADILHVCFPYFELFTNQVKEYIKKVKPVHTIVYSTVPIGTCVELNVVHSPVEGRHPQLADSIRKMTRWIGTANHDEFKFFSNLFLSFGMSTRWAMNSNYTEFLKLRSTAKYGINLIWTDYEKKVADEIGMDFGLLKQFDTDYNNLYKGMGMHWAQRYILNPPDGKIGGHCIVPNAELLDEQYPSELLRMIKEYE